MASRATWRTVPGDPRSRLGWLAREGPRWMGLVFRKALLAISLFALYALLVGAGTTFVLAALAFCAVLSAAFPERTDGPAFADPSPCPIFAGTVEILREDVLLGEDRVIVTFADGWLLVEGHRTTFALRRNDVVETTRPVSDNVLRFEDGIRLRFCCSMIQGADGKRPPSYQDYPGSRVHFQGFASYLSDWFREGEFTSGEPTLPPDRPHPSSFAKSTLDLAVAATGSVAALTLLFALNPLWALGAFFFTPGPRLPEAVQAYVQLRRVARGQ